MHSTTEGQNEIPYTEKGYLIVNVVSANEALPIEGATVSIKGNDGQNKNYELIQITDESGLTEIISLATPSKELSLKPGNAASYSSYNVIVSKDGYYTREFTHIPIFDGVTSLQRINLIAQTPFNSGDFNPNQSVPESGPMED